MDGTSGFYPGRAALDAVGDGGFRFAGMGHRGSILILPDGIHAWPPLSAAELTLADFAAVVQRQAEFEFLLIGTGATHVPLALDLVAELADAGITAEGMNTRAAARTYSVLFAEHRRVAAALIAVP